MCPMDSSFFFSSSGIMSVALCMIMNGISCGTFNSPFRIFRIISIAPDGDKCRSASIISISLLLQRTSMASSLLATVMVLSPAASSIFFNILRLLSLSSAMRTFLMFLIPSAAQVSFSIEFAGRAIVKLNVLPLPS